MLVCFLLSPRRPSPHGSQGSSWWYEEGRNGKVKKWLNKNEKYIRLFFLPRYSPELNPDEILNQDVKSNAVGRKRARCQSELIANVGSFLWGRQRRPNVVKKYFSVKHVSFAAA
jgi:hypothetical protein